MIGTLGCQFAVSDIGYMVGVIKREVCTSQLRTLYLSSGLYCLCTVFCVSLDHPFATATGKWMNIMNASIAPIQKGELFPNALSELSKYLKLINNNANKTIV